MSLPAAGLMVIALPFVLGFVLTMMGHAAARAAARPHRPPPPPKSRATVGRNGGWQKPVSPPLSAARPRPPDRLTETTRAWLDDDRPAWETVDAFERDVQLALEGRSDAAERMARHPGAIVV